MLSVHSWDAFGEKSNQESIQRRIKTGPEISGPVSFSGARGGISALLTAMLISVRASTNSEIAINMPLAYLLNAISPHRFKSHLIINAHIKTGPEISGPVSFSGARGGI